LNEIFPALVSLLNSHDRRYFLHRRYITVSVFPMLDSNEASCISSYHLPQFLLALVILKIISNISFRKVLAQSIQTKLSNTRTTEAFHINDDSDDELEFVDTMPPPSTSSQPLLDCYISLSPRRLLPHPQSILAGPRPPAPPKLSRPQVLGFTGSSSPSSSLFITSMLVKKTHSWDYPTQTQTQTRLPPSARAVSTSWASLSGILFVSLFLKTGSSSWLS
jgi:hypothetical protein